MRNPVWPSSCVTPAGTSNELDVQLLLLLLFLTFSALIANPKKNYEVLYTVANPARGLLNRGKKEKKSLAAPPSPAPPRTARSEKKKKGHATYLHV